ncbi:MAG: ribosome silencing factor [Candidatus Omnitrophica bacterium]|nr:ribosome silencing factor [Candidatus Omnitrophota bacterium]
MQEKINIPLTKKTQISKARYPTTDDKELAIRIAHCAQEKKGEKIVILDLRKIGGFCDFFVIVSANSTRQINAIAEAIQEKLITEHRKPLVPPQPNDESGWVVLDYASVVVHIFTKQMRQFYALEHLWSDARRIRIPKSLSSSKS